MFNYEDIAPGFNSEEQTVTLKNTGSIDLKYRVSVEPITSGDENDLFKTLNISINVYDADNNLKSAYFINESKTLDELKNFEIDEFVPAGKERNIGFTVVLPTDIGNEMQDITTSFKFVFDTVQSDGSF